MSTPVTPLVSTPPRLTEVSHVPAPVVTSPASVAPTRLTATTLGGLRLQKVSELDPLFNLLIYGNPGVGKTRLAGSCDAVPSMRNVLHLDMNGGPLSIREYYPNVQTLTVTSWKRLQAIYNDLYADASHGFRTVILDTGTEAQKINMVEIMDKVVKKAKEEDGKDRDPEVPSVREWGISTEQMRRMVRGFRDLPMNFIMACHVRDDKDEKTGITTKCPDLPGKLARQIAGMFDECWYMYVKEVDKGNGDKEELRLLLTRASEKITAKDRTAKLPPIITDCNMKSIHAIMTGESK